MNRPRSIPGSGRSAGEGIGYPLQYSGAYLVAQLVKNPPTMWERPRFDPWVGKILWRRGRLPIPVFWPGEFHGLYSPWGRKESDTTEWLSLHCIHVETDLCKYTDTCNLVIKRQLWYYSVTSMIFHRGREESVKWKKFMKNQDSFYTNRNKTIEIRARHLWRNHLYFCLLSIEKRYRNGYLHCIHG